MICLHNVVDGDVFRYSLPLFVGFVEGINEDGVINVCVEGDGDVLKKQDFLEWPIIQGSFRVFVQLFPGDNVVHILYKDDMLNVPVSFQCPSLCHYVLPVYIVCLDDTGYFQGPDAIDRSPESAVKRISLGAQIIQSFTAEKMNEHGFGRLTFQLESCDRVRPLCRVFRSRLKLEQAVTMSGKELWSFLGTELVRSDLSGQHLCKWLCFLSFTRYLLPVGLDVPTTYGEILAHTVGHAALGRLTSASSFVDTCD